MALITCPECGNTISSESSYCIHCGYPLKEDASANKTVYTQTVEQDYVVIVTGYSGTSKNKAISAIVDVCGYSYSEAKEIINDLPQEVVRGATRELSVSVAQGLDAEGLDASIYQGNTQVSYTSKRSSGSGFWKTLGIMSMMNAAYRRPRRIYFSPYYAPRPRTGLFGSLFNPQPNPRFGGPVNRANPYSGRMGGGSSRGGFGGPPSGNMGKGPGGGRRGR